MSPDDLFTAATKLETAALDYARLADRAELANKPELAALHGAVSKQFRDRAAQVCLWAKQARITGTVTPDMEAGTGEFLQYAGV